ncbi:MAG TPA: OmpA family protein [Flavobacterium sp.]|nr:OmpA family protein [Flavobacterium sp.]
MKLKIIALLFFLSGSVSAQQQFTVYFEFDQYSLNTIAANRLDSLLGVNGNIEVTKLYGFCDWKGTNPYNDSLSLKRVHTVFDYLKTKNIKVSDSHEIRGFGEDFKQSKVQAENRKVVIVYEPKSTSVKMTATENSNSGLQDKIKNAKTGDLIKLENIYFFNMSPRILPRSKTTMHDLLCALQDNPNLKIEIQGHICCQESGDINSLSVQRAKAIYNFLVANKINRKRLSFKGFGVTRPIHPIPEKTELEQDENRRVEIMIVEN